MSRSVNKMALAIIWLLITGSVLTVSELDFVEYTVGLCPGSEYPRVVYLDSHLFYLRT